MASEILTAEVQRRSSDRWCRFVALAVLLVLGSWLINVVPAAHGDGAPVSLTPEERAWLQAHPVIRLAPDPEFRPIEFFDHNGLYQGVAADHVRLLEQRLGIRFSIVRLKNWDEVMDRFQHRQVDLLGAIVPTTQRLTFMLFTDPLIEVPGGIFIRNGSPRTLTLTDLEGMRVAVVSNYTAHDYLQSQHPRLLLDVVPDTATGLSKVSFGIDDAYVENMATAVYYLQRQGISNLRLAGRTDFSYRWGMGVRQDWPLLQSILNKGLAAISKDEKQAILNRWIYVEGEGWQPSPVQFAMVVVVVLLLGLAAVVLWNQSLRQQVLYRTESLNRELDERCRVEVALRQEKETAQRYLDVAGVIMVVIGLDGVVTLINRKGCQILGYSEAEVIGANWFERFIPPRWHGALTSLIQRLKIGEESGDYFENPVMTREGAERLISWHNTALRDDDGEIHAFLSSGEDITARRLAEAEIRAINASLEERVVERTAQLRQEIADRQRAEQEVRRLNADLEERVAEQTSELQHTIRELEGFCYSVSHDLRAPLRHINSYSAIISEEYGTSLDRQGQELLQRINQASNRMGQLIDDLLGLTRTARAEMNMVEVDLTAICQELGNELRQGEPDRQASFIIADGLGAKADPLLVRVVLQNLLDNAWKYTSKRQSATIEVGNLDKGGELIFFVRDDGVGFDMAYANKLFLPFQRLHRDQDFPGTGIGLATVQRIIQRHGGRIWVEAAPGQGASFFFTLP